MAALGSGRAPASGRLFVYGTLRDPDLCARLLGANRGHALRRVALGDAHAPRYRAVMGAGRTYPYLVRDATGDAPGLLIEGLTPRQLTRLVRYEGDDYRLGSITVTVPGRGRVRALAFLPARRARAVRCAPFALARWQARGKARALTKLRR